MLIASRMTVLMVILCTAIGFRGSDCFAQIQRWDAEPRVANKDAAGTDEQGRPLWKITPAAEPQPPLRYRLWPARDEMVPGNAMVPFHRAMVMMLEGRSGQDWPSAFHENYEAWMEGPLEELPVEPIKQYLQSKKSILAELHRMEHLQEVEYDLGIEMLSGVAAIQFMLPEIQNSRELARLLVLEARLALAEGRFEDALRSLRTGVRLSDAVGATGDLLVIKLVGIAITGIMLGQVEEASGLPGSPNMYWALAMVPESTYDIQSAIEFELSIVSRVFPELADLPDEPVGPAAWQDRLVRVIQNWQRLGSSSAASESSSGSSAKLLSGLAVLALAEPSREQLRDEKLAAVVVRQMSPSEVILRATANSLERVEDSFVKWFLLPDALHQQALDRYETFEREQLSGRFPSNLAVVIVQMLLPASRAAESAERRTAQTIARLATVEAIRDYAAANGELPTSLEDVTQLPPWPDPLTDQPFGYKRIDPLTAELTSQRAYPNDRNVKVVLQLVEPAGDK